jgi:uncharacterized membrane protein
MRPREIESVLIEAFTLDNTLSLNDLVNRTKYSYTGIFRAIKRMELENKIEVIRNNGETNTYKLI